MPLHLFRERWDGRQDRRHFLVALDVLIDPVVREKHLLHIWMDLGHGPGHRHRRPGCLPPVFPEWFNVPEGQPADDLLDIDLLDEPPEVGPITFQGQPTDEPLQRLAFYSPLATSTR